MRAYDSRGRRDARALCTALAYCALCCARGAAQAPPVEAGGVQLSIPDCEDVSGEEIAKLVALELAPHAAPAASGANGAPATPTRASVRCAADHAMITVTDPRRPNPLELELALGATPHEARARFVALAVAELIATSRLERSEARTPPAPPPAPPPPAEPSQEPEPAYAARPLSLFVEAGAARALEPALFAPAFAAGVSFAWAPFALIGDVAYERGQTSTPDAMISAHSISLSVAPAFQIAMRRVTLSLALGMRGGYASIAADPRQAGLEGHSVSGLYLAPIAGAGLQFAFTQRWAMRVALEFGYVIKPVRGFDADGGALLAVSGARGTALLGVAWSP